MNKKNKKKRKKVKKKIKITYTYVTYAVRKTNIRKRMYNFEKQIQ